MRAIHYSKKIIFSSIAGLVLYLISGCNKLVVADVPGMITPDERAWATDANAISVLNAIYGNMSTNLLPSGSSVNSFMTFYGGLAADELTLFGPASQLGYLAYYNNDVLDNVGPNLWLDAYPYINKLNLAVDGISASTGLSSNVKTQLLGEAKFLRALHYFYLVNLYGPVPLVLGNNYKVNALLPRSPVDTIYKQITADLLDAQNLLSDHFVGKDEVSATDERVVPNKWTAKALLARVYLYTGKYEQAVASATEVIDNTTLFELVDLQSVFVKNSREALWQLQPVNLGWNTEDARVFKLPESGPGDPNPVYLSDAIVGAFEPGDQRRAQWVDSVIADGSTYRFPNKYKANVIEPPIPPNVVYDPAAEYQMVIRLAEVYLIRAEAQAELGHFSEAASDLNSIRSRAGLGNYTGGLDEPSLLAAILQERRVELFTEWGHRWLDLKRRVLLDTYMTQYEPVKGGNWSSTDQLFPIFRSELNADPNLTQNDGY